MDDIVTVTFLRHGVTKENIEKRYIGWSDVSLVDDIENIENIETSTSFQLIYSSDLKRCIETAKMISPFQNNIIKDHRLREIHFGLWERKTYNDLKNDQHYRQWIDDPFLLTPPKGENFKSFQYRLLESWDEIIAQFEQEDVRNILIVSHGGPIRMFLSFFSPEDCQKKWWDWKIDYFSGYTLKWQRKMLKEGGSRCTSLLVEPFTAKNSG